MTQVTYEHLPGGGRGERNSQEILQPRQELPVSCAYDLVTLAGVFVIRQRVVPQLKTQDYQISPFRFSSKLGDVFFCGGEGHADHFCSSRRGASPRRAVPPALSSFYIRITSVSCARKKNIYKKTLERSKKCRQNNEQTPITRLTITQISLKCFPSFDL